MSSILLALLIIFDVIALVRRNIHSILVDVNPFGMHHCDTSFQKTKKDTQHNSRPIASSLGHRHFVRILLRTVFTHTSGRTSDLAA